MEKKLKPHWGGVVAVVAFLYGLWAASSIYTGTGSHEGPGIIGIYILMSIIFFTVMMITVFPVGWALILLKHDFLRLCFVLIALGIFLVGYGIPSFVVISIAVVFFLSGYFSGKKAREDAADLKTFLDKHDGN